MTARLQIEQLVAGYGALEITEPVDLQVQSGEILAMLGPNGAGKTTLLTTISGLQPRIRGRVSVDGQPLPSGDGTKANRAGVVIVPSERALFTALSVRDNIRLARRPGGAEDEEILELFEALRQRWTTPAGALSGGEQQMLALARALVQRPKVLLLDEMSMGLAPIIVERLLPIVRHVADERDAAVVLVEQHSHLALEVADRALVLVHGRIALDGESSWLLAHPRVLEAAYLGGDVGAEAAPAGVEGP